jgi:hypothetical protein
LPFREITARFGICLRRQLEEKLLKTLDKALLGLDSGIGRDNGDARTSVTQIAEKSVSSVIATIWRNIAVSYTKTKAARRSGQ